MSAASVSAAGSFWTPHAVAIRAIRPEVGGVATYELGFADRAAAEAYRFAPGQFNMLYLPGAGEVPISLSADPASRDTWAHTIRVAGNVTRRLAAMQPGDTLGLRGPYGSCWPLEEAAGADVLLVAGGIGLAPLRPAILALLAERERYGRLMLLYGARSPDTLLYAHEYDEWSRRGLLVHTTVDRSAAGWLGNVGVVSLLVERVRPLDPARTVVFSCGPEIMMRYSVAAAEVRGIAASRVWVSLERNMQCAVGMCGHCQLGPAFVCREGPVFRYDQMEPYLDVPQL